MCRLPAGDNNAEISLGLLQLGFLFSGDFYQSTTQVFDDLPLPDYFSYGHRGLVMQLRVAIGSVNLKWAFGPLHVQIASHVGHKIFTVVVVLKIVAESIKGLDFQQLVLCFFSVLLINQVMKEDPGDLILCNSTRRPVKRSLLALSGLDPVVNLGQS